MSEFEFPLTVTKYTVPGHKLSVQTWEKLLTAGCKITIDHDTRTETMFGNYVQIAQITYAEITTTNEKQNMLVHMLLDNFEKISEVSVKMSKYNVNFDK